MDASQRTTLTIALTWPLVVAAVTAYWLDQRHTEAVVAATSGLTPIAVIDSVAFMQRSEEGATPNERAQGGLTAARAMANRLRESGYIVLDRNLVVSAPDAILVQP